MSKADEKLLRDVAALTTCYKQAHDGWYVDSCFEAGWGVRRCCVGCRVLKRLEKRLRDTEQSEEGCHERAH